MIFLKHQNDFIITIAQLLQIPCLKPWTTIYKHHAIWLVNSTWSACANTTHPTVSVMVDSRGGCRVAGRTYDILLIGD